MCPLTQNVHKNYSGVNILFIRYTLVSPKDQMNLDISELFSAL